MCKLLERLLEMRHGPAMYLGKDSLLAVTNYITGYEAAAKDAGVPCDGLRGFDEWVNLRMLLPPGSTRWSGRISSAAGTTHQHTHPDARDAEQRECWLFFEWLEEFAAERAARGVDAIIAEHDTFAWPEVVEDWEGDEE